MNFIVKTKYNASEGEMGAFTLLTDYFIGRELEHLKDRIKGKIRENNFDNNILRLNDLCYLALNYFFLQEKKKQKENLVLKA